MKIAGGKEKGGDERLCVMRAQLIEIAKQFDPEGSGHRQFCQLLGEIICRYGGSVRWFRAPWGARWCVFAVSCGDPSEEYERDMDAKMRAMEACSEHLRESGALVTWTTADLLAPLVERSSEAEAQRTLEQWRDARRSRTTWLAALAEEDARIAVCEATAVQLGIALTEEADD